MDDLKEMRKHCKWKDQALERTLHTIRFARGDGAVVRQTT